MSDTPKRKHRSTGRPRGGARSGAGRREGTKNVLPLGAVKAVKAAGLRVPGAATAAERALADRAQQRIIDVMEGTVRRNSLPVLSAARVLREEICGPVKQRVEHSFADKSDEQLEKRYREITGATSVAAPPAQPTCRIIVQDAENAHLCGLLMPCPLHQVAPKEPT